MENNNISDLLNELGLVEPNGDRVPLYKYRNFQTGKHLSLLAPSKLDAKTSVWFASPTSFNDPFDCQINDQTTWTDDLIRDYVTRTIALTGEAINPDDVVNANKSNPGSFKAFFTKRFKSVLAKQGVSCFITMPDNLLMWALYSASHQGVCLKFDITEDSDLFMLTFRVKYSADYPEFDYLKERSELVKKAMLSKSDDWEYEDEVRVLKPKFGLQPFNKAALKEIIFGCKTPPDEIKTIRQIIKDAKYPDIKLKQVKLKEHSFKIDIIDI